MRQWSCCCDYFTMVWWYLFHWYYLFLICCGEKIFLIFFSCCFHCFFIFTIFRNILCFQWFRFFLWEWFPITIYIGTSLLCVYAVLVLMCLLLSLLLGGIDFFVFYASTFVSTFDVLWWIDSDNVTAFNYFSNFDLVADINALMFSMLSLLLPKFILLPPFLLL